MDIFSQVKRSDVMSRIKSSGTSAEMFVRRLLFSDGFRYRLDRKDLPGKPDIVLPKYKVVIFVHGCFWHGHEGCKKASIPEQNAEFWKEKINRNKQRDGEVVEQLLADSWRVMIVWGCALKKRSADILLERMRRFIKYDESCFIEISAEDLSTDSASIADK